MPCDTSFLGHFARSFRKWKPFEPMTSSNLIFDGGKAMVIGQVKKTQNFQINTFE